MLREKIRSIVYRMNGWMTVLLRSIHKGFCCQTSLNTMIAPSAELSVAKSANVIVGKSFAMLKGAALVCRPGATVNIGNNVTFGMRNYINVHEKVSIGDNVNFAPDVKIYDHDHDIKNYSMDSLEWRNHYVTAPVIIGSNVWIGANVVILRGTVIGDNCVIGAGAVLKGEYPSNSIIIQKRTDITRAF